MKPTRIGDGRDASAEGESAVWVALRWRRVTQDDGTPLLRVDALLARNAWALAADAIGRMQKQATGPQETDLTAIVRCPLRGLSLDGSWTLRPVLVLISFEGQFGEPIQARLKPICVVPADAELPPELLVDGRNVHGCLRAPCNLLQEDLQ